MNEYSRFVKNTADLLAHAEYSEYREQLASLALMLIEKCAPKYGKTVDEVILDIFAQ